MDTVKAIIQSRLSTPNKTCFITTLLAILLVINTPTLAMLNPPAQKLTQRTARHILPSLEKQLSKNIHTQISAFNPTDIDLHNKAAQLKAYARLSTMHKRAVSHIPKNQPSLDQASLNSLQKAIDDAEKELDALENNLKKQKIEFEKTRDQLVKQMNRRISGKTPCAFRGILAGGGTAFILLLLFYH